MYSTLNTRRCLKTMTRRRISLKKKCRQWNKKARFKISLLLIGTWLYKQCLIILFKIYIKISCFKSRSILPLIRSWKPFKVILALRDRFLIKKTNLRPIQVVLGQNRRYKHKKKMKLIRNLEPTNQSYKNTKTSKKEILQ